MLGSLIQVKLARTFVPGCMYGQEVMLERECILSASETTIISFKGTSSD